MEHLILLFIKTMQRKEAARDPFNGELVLKYGWFIRGISILIAAGFPVLGTGLLLTDGLWRDDVLFSIIVIAFAFGGLAFVLETFGVSIRLGDASIVAHAPWRMPKAIKWSEIDRIKYSHSMGLFIIRASDGTKIRASSLISGLGSLAAEIRSRLRPTVYADAESGFASIDV